MLIAAVFGKGIFLLPHHRLDSSGPVALRQHRLRRFPAPLPRHRAEQLSARTSSDSADAALSIPTASSSSRCSAAGCSFSLAASPTGYPALRRRRFPRLHAFAVRHGRALAEESRPALAEERAGQRTGRLRHRHHRRRRAGCEIRRRAPGSRSFSFPLTIVFFIAVRRHYHSVKMLTTCSCPVDTASLSQPPIAVVPIDHWSNITRQGLEFAARLSPEVIALHVEPNEHSEVLHDDWDRYVEQPFRAAGKEPPKLESCLRPIALSSFPSFSSFSISRRTSRPQHHRGHPGTRRRPLVRIFSAQSARPPARMDPPRARQ